MQPRGSIIRLPRGLQRRVDAAIGALLIPRKGGMTDFSRPPGEEALVAPDSVSWRIFKNPVALFIGGVAAVILELAEPVVRTGIWEHSSFRNDPIGRMQRTGLAALTTVYAARSIAEPMIVGVVRMHDKVTGATAAGVPYAANDERLLNWVQATAAFGFAQAYSRYVNPLDPTEFDELYRESAPAARLYGALDTPKSDAELQALFESMRNRLEPSPIVFEFLQIMHQTPACPRSLLWMQRVLLRAAVDLTPEWIRERLGLDERHGLRPREKWLVKLAGSLSDRIILPESPAVQSCVRLGLPITHLYA
jgi:uncharacterized protein (DUF2236 family)